MRSGASGLGGDGETYRNGLAGDIGRPLQALKSGVFLDGIGRLPETLTDLGASGHGRGGMRRNKTTTTREGFHH